MLVYTVQDVLKVSQVGILKTVQKDFKNGNNKCWKCPPELALQIRYRFIKFKKTCFKPATHYSRTMTKKERMDEIRANCE